MGDFNMRIIAVCNQKGGTGKTTSTVNIGAGLAMLGHRVLLIDLDPQFNLSFSLGLSESEIITSVYEVLSGQSEVNQALMTVNGLKLLPARSNLSQVDAVLNNKPYKEHLLQRTLQNLACDYILLDCPPSYGLITVNALTAAQEVFVPVQAEFLALHGLSKLLETISSIQSQFNKELKLGGIIITRYDQRKVLNREVLSSLEEHFPGTLFKTVIRENIALAEAPSFGQDIFRYRPDSNGARDYMNLCREIMERR